MHRPSHRTHLDRIILGVSAEGIVVNASRPRAWTERHSSCFLTQQRPMYVSRAIRGMIKYMSRHWELNS